jgi:hypothetical protein
MKLGLIARAAGAAALVLSSAAAVQAAPVTYTIDANNSLVGLTGSVDGEFFSGQISGVAVSNQFKADRAGNAFQFVDGAAGIVANRGRVLPGPDGDPFNSAQGNFAFTSPDGGVQGAVRDLRFHFVSPSATTISGGSVPADSFEIAVDSGTLDFIYGTYMASVDLSRTTPAQYLFNAATKAVTVSQAGDQETVTVPFKFTIPTSTTPFGDTNTFLTFNGEAVGTGTVAAVPEPAGLFVLAGAGVLLGRRRR